MKQKHLSESVAADPLTHWKPPCSCFLFLKDERVNDRSFVSSSTHRIDRRSWPSLSHSISNLTIGLLCFWRRANEGKSPKKRKGDRMLIANAIQACQVCSILWERRDVNPKVNLVYEKECVKILGMHFTRFSSNQIQSRLHSFSSPYFLPSDHLPEPERWLPHISSNSSVPNHNKLVLVHSLSSIHALPAKHASPLLFPSPLIDLLLSPGFAPSEGERDYQSLLHDFGSYYHPGSRIRDQLGDWYCEPREMVWSLHLLVSKDWCRLENGSRSNPFQSCCTWCDSLSSQLVICHSVTNCSTSYWLCHYWIVVSCM